MLWFASKLLSSIFSLAPNRFSKKVTADSTPYRTISASSSFTTLVDDQVSDCPKIGMFSLVMVRLDSNAT